MAEIGAIFEDAEGDDAESEDGSTGFQVPAERLLRIGESDVGMDLAVDNIPFMEIRSAGAVGFVTNMFRRKSRLLTCALVARRARAGQDDAFLIFRFTIFHSAAVGAGRIGGSGRSGEWEWHRRQNLFAEALGVVCRIGRRW